jgi:hypothetical protein
MSAGESHFSSTLPIVILTRPSDQPEADWQDFDQGPGYFHIPAGLDIRIEARNLDNYLLADLIGELQDLPALRFLDLAENRNVDDAGLPRLSALPQLTHLSLSACNISDIGLENLPTFAKLEFLNLSYCPRLTDRSLRTVERLPRLRYLDLQGCVKITHAGVARIEKRGLTIN